MGLSDTSPFVEALQAEIHKRMGGERRLSIAMDMSMATRELALSRIRKYHPEKSGREIMKVYFQEILSLSGLHSDRT